MKTPEELNELKAETETTKSKLAELNGEELEQVIGGQAVLPLLSNSGKEEDQQII